MSSGSPKPELASIHHHDAVLTRLQGHSKLHDARSLTALLPQPATTHSVIVVLHGQRSLESGLVRRALEQGSADEQRPHFLAEITHTYSSVLHGFAARMSAEALAAVIEHDDVQFVEFDREVTPAGEVYDTDVGDGVVDGLPIDPALMNNISVIDIAADVNALAGGGSGADAGGGGSRTDVEGASTTVINPVRSWGLDRLDQIGLPLDKSYAYAFDGSGVDGTHRRCRAKAVLTRALVTQPVGF